MSLSRKTPLPADGGNVVNLAPLAERITAKQRTYERLSQEAWEALDVTTAIRYRGMAEAYRDVVGNDLPRFVRDTAGGERS